MLSKKLLKNKSSEPEVPGEPNMSVPNLCWPSESNEQSPYFNKIQQPIRFITPSVPVWQRFYAIECRLNESLARLTFQASTTTTSPKVAAVYNPVEYARRLHCQYLERFLGDQRPTTLFVGMNPGPWGMCQTGIPFGCVSIVRNWMRLSGYVDRPDFELRDRPVTGLDCTHEEASGKKFWQLFRDIFGEQPELFFAANFVHNFCPLAFLAEGGRNITPAELKGDVRLELQRLCGEAFLEIIELLSPSYVISVGRYVESRVQAVLKSRAISLSHLCMPHPSPRSLNNANWPDKAKAWLQDNQIIL